MYNIMSMDKDVLKVMKKIDEAGFEVAIVGGAVRDFLAKKEVGDWDLTTSARPEEILKIFPDSFYNNAFGTVGIPIRESKSQGVKELKVIEITTYRTEESYSDARHPDEVKWGDSLEEDLKRRDFTINAVALRYTKSKPFPGELVDPFGGQTDLKNKIVRTVGNPDERFNEDALRLLRAIRFAATLGFEIEAKTKAAITSNAKQISKISGERIRDEIFKIVESENCDLGFFLLRDVGLLPYILPELDVCFKVEQKSPKRHHVFDVGTHCVMSLKHCPSTKTAVRLATLLHDIGKAKVADVTEEGVRTFYNHEVAGAHQVLEIADRLHLSRDDKQKLFKLVRWHQFSVSEDQTDKAVRRFIVNVGLDNVEDMMDLRVGDRLGGGLEEPESWRLKLFRDKIKNVLTKPFTVQDLKINGRDVMEAMKIKPGPKVGKILNQLFEEVLEDDEKNTREYLMGKLDEIRRK